MNRQYAVGVRWRKSTYSDDTGGQCVEVAHVPTSWRKSRRSTDTEGACVKLASMVPLATTDWQKSSKSDNTGGACVEVTHVVSAVAVRDSKDPDGPKLLFGAAAWRAFATQAKDGALDLR